MNRIEGSKSTTGEEIKLHDVFRSVRTVEAFNHYLKIKGLAVENRVTGVRAWLSVYPQGELEVIANLKQ